VQIEKKCQLLIQHFFPFKQKEGVWAELFKISQCCQVAVGNFSWFLVVVLIYWLSNLSLLFSYKLINKSSSLVLYSSLVLGANLLRRRLPTDGPNIRPQEKKQLKNVERLVQPPLLLPKPLPSAGIEKKMLN
jgi:hypothetical protein